MAPTKKVLCVGDQSTIPNAGDVVEVTYIGWFHKEAARHNRGRRFDASAPNTLYRFVVGSDAVITGFSSVVTQMSVGERTVWTIPSELAYGESGYPGIIPPHQTLIFEIELRNVVRQV